MLSSIIFNLHVKNLRLREVRSPSEAKAVIAQTGFEVDLLTSVAHAPLRTVRRKKRKR